MRKFIYFFLLVATLGITGCNKNKAENVPSSKETETIEKEESKKDESNIDDSKKEESKNEQPKEEETKEEAKAPVGYDPQRVVSLVITKCEAGGMITTEHNLQNLLNEGKITKEEYDEYYPLDGLDNSYYSVFVNSDLNKASTSSNKLLGIEEAIADYIASMLLTESHSIFSIKHTGTYSMNGETFYEFRCYR